MRLLLLLGWCAIWAVAGYQRATWFARRYGRTQWGWDPSVWAVVFGLNWVIGIVLLAIAERQGRREAQRRWPGNIGMAAPGQLPHPVPPAPPVPPGYPGAVSGAAPPMPQGQYGYAAAPAPPGQCGQPPQPGPQGQFGYPPAGPGGGQQIPSQFGDTQGGGAGQPPKWPRYGGM